MKPYSLDLRQKIIETYEENREQVKAEEQTAILILKTK